MVYLAATYGLIWVGVVVYLLHLTQRERKLEREIGELRAHLVEGNGSGTRR
jgi:CcmD family protein